MTEMSNRNLVDFHTAATFPVSILILLVVVIAVGIASYFAIEYPTQHMRHLFNREGHLVNRYLDN